MRIPKWKSNIKLALMCENVSIILFPVTIRKGEHELHVSTQR